MLTISFVLSALTLLAAASPAPLAQDGIRIPISRRNDTPGDRIDPDQIKALIAGVVG